MSQESSWNTPGEAPTGPTTHIENDGVPGTRSRELLTEQEAAAVLRSDTGHVRRLVRQRRLAVVRDGHWIRIPLSDVESFLEHARIEAEGA